MSKSETKVDEKEVVATVDLNIQENSQTQTKKSNIFIRAGRYFASTWKNFKTKHPNIAQFAVFFLLSNGVTVLQLIMMPVLKAVFETTSLINSDFQIWQVGKNPNGTNYFVFDYAAGSLASGGGGGLAYFLSVQLTIGIAQIINFFAQRNLTFKSNSNIWWAAMWYLIAYILITIGAAALQGVYKEPIYSFLIKKLGSGGETLADVITMIINSAISFWVFFPIFKVIFKNKKEQKV